MQGLDASTLLDVQGAPFDQGVAQGVAGRAAIRLTLEGMRRRLGWVGLREACGEVSRSSGLTQRRHLLHQHERLLGIAAGAGVAAEELGVLDEMIRVSGTGSVCGGELEIRLDLPPDLNGLLCVRRSAADAVGLPSIELSSALWPGCLAGINACGIGVVVIDDRNSGEVSLRALAQDLMLRAEGLASGLSHLRLRAAYSGGTGRLLVADAAGRAHEISLHAGAFVDHPLCPRSVPVSRSTVGIDLQQRTLTWYVSPRRSLTFCLEGSGKAQGPDPSSSPQAAAS